MERVFSEAAWIWYTETAAPDTYGDFVDRFYYKQGKKVLCRVSCDGDYTLFVNGHYASSNQYGDFEHAKSYDTLDLTPYLSEGENTVLFTVWHVGIASSRYRPATAGLLYEIERDGALLCVSGENTLCAVFYTMNVSSGLSHGLQKLQHSGEILRKVFFIHS